MSAERSAAQRVIGRPFQKGQTGNAGGMPKGWAKKLRKLRASLAELDEKAMRTLEALMASTDEKVQAKALEIWAKHRIPALKETTDEAAINRTLPGVQLPDNVRHLLERMR